LAETLNESRRLQSSLYNNDSFYAKTEDKIDPKVISEFKDLTLKAKNLAQARLKQNPKDVEALYFLGATEGLKAPLRAQFSVALLLHCAMGRTVSTPSECDEA